MPNFAESNENMIQDIIDTGGLDKNTLKKQQYAQNYFHAYLKLRGNPGIDDLLKDKMLLQDCLIGYFNDLRVNGNDLPMRGTSEVHRSFIKKMIMTKSEGVLDISCDATFQKFTAFYKGYIRNLKKNGKGDTKHRQEIPNDSLIKITTMLKLICNLMGTKDKLTMVNGMADLPEQYRNKLHYLAQYGAQFILMSHTAKRGVEGLSDYKKEYLGIKTDLDTKLRYYKQVNNIIIGWSGASEVLNLKNLTF
jgi:hypothetical protein